MKYIILIITVLILTGNQFSFSQISFLKGKFIDYETGKVIPGVTMVFYAQSGIEFNAYNDVNGDFELITGAESGYLIIQFLNYYTMKLINIPGKIKQIDLGEIRMVKNFGLPESTMDGSLVELTKEQIEKDKKLRKDVLENYRIKIFSKNLKPYFAGNYLVFDFNSLE